MVSISSVSSTRSTTLVCPSNLCKLLHGSRTSPENLRLGIDAAKKAGGVCEAVVCYSGDLADPKKTKYTLQYYLDFVDELVAEGIHVLGIKDMAGLLKPEAARQLVGAIRRKYPDLPIHVHSHDTAGISAASMLAAAAAGADVIDVAIDSACCEITIATTELTW
jgi:pyruvate carboxylase